MKFGNSVEKQRPILCHWVYKSEDNLNQNMQTMQNIDSDLNISFIIYPREDLHRCIMM